MRTSYAILLSLFLMTFGIPALAQVATSQSNEQTAICTFPDDAEISVRYLPVEYDKKTEPPPGKAWAPGGMPIYLFTPIELLVGNTAIPTGAYSIYTIPNKGTWVLVINKNVAQGASYDEKQDLVRINMETVKAIVPNKPLTVTLGHIAPKVCSLQIVFGDTGAWTELKEK